MNSLRAMGACVRLAIVCFFLLTAPIASEKAAFGGAAPKSSSHVYILRGFVNIFSPGMNTLATELQQRGISASVHDYTEWLSLTEMAIKNYRNGREKSIVVIGHSLGAGAASSMAQQLGHAGIPVKLVVTFDPVIRPIISANVVRAYNFYVSNGIGTSAERASNVRGSLSNINRQDLGHVSITTTPDIHRKVIGYVSVAVGFSAPHPAVANGQNVLGSNSHSQTGTAPPEGDAAY